MIAEAAVGDARVAITALREAARQARREGLDVLTRDVIEAAVPEAESEIRQKSVDRLTPHQRVLYDIIRDAGEVEPADLYAAYRDRVDDPKSDRTVRNYLSKMERYNLVRAKGENRGRRYEYVG